MWLRCDSLLELTIGDYLACPCYLRTKIVSVKNKKYRSRFVTTVWSF